MDTIPQTDAQRGRSVASGVVGRLREGFQGGLEHIEPIVRVESPLCPMAIDAEKAPERQAIDAHPFLCEAAGQALACSGRQAPVLVTSSRSLMHRNVTGMGST